MGTYEKLLAMARSDMTFSQKLYRLLSDRKYSTYPYHKIGLGDNMSSINYGYCECEITRFLLNHNIKEAYEVTLEVILFSWKTNLVHFHQLLSDDLLMDWHYSNGIRLRMVVPTKTQTATE